MTSTINAQNAKPSYSERVKRKQALINEYTTKQGWKDTYPTRGVRKPCDWCERFKENDFFHCLNCGSVFK